MLRGGEAQEGWDQVEVDAGKEEPGVQKEVLIFSLKSGTGLIGDQLV